MLSSVLCLGSLISAAFAACPPALGPVQPHVATGWKLYSVVSNLTDPRAIILDKQGNLLLVDGSTGGISGYKVTDNGGCDQLTDRVDVVAPGLNLTLGIQLDGERLFASSADKVYSWTYNSHTRSTSNQRTLVTGLFTPGYAVRPIALSKSVPGTFYIGRGAVENLDLNAATKQGGIAQVRAFSYSSSQSGPVDWLSGQLIAWGVRQPLGINEHPTNFGIWSINTEPDSLTRNGTNISARNPADELFNFGTLLNGTSVGHNFGYPFCYTVADASVLPNNAGLVRGGRFAIDPIEGQSRTDEQCNADFPLASLTFDAHTTPTDLKFLANGNKLLFSSFGAWSGIGGTIWTTAMTDSGTRPSSDFTPLVNSGSQRFISIAVRAETSYFVLDYKGAIYSLSTV